MLWYFANIWNTYWYYLCNKKITNQPNLFLYWGTAAQVDGNVCKKKLYQNGWTLHFIIKMLLENIVDYSVLRRSYSWSKGEMDTRVTC